MTCLTNKTATCEQWIVDDRLLIGNRSSDTENKSQNQFENNHNKEASSLTPLVKKQLIKECVEEVMRKLEDKLDR